MKLSIVAADLMLPALVTALNGGSIRIYDGTMPVAPETAITTQVLLAEPLLADPCGTILNGVLTFAGVVDDSSANATGTATWVRFVKADGTAILDESIGGDVTINNAAIVTGMKITVTGMTYSPL